jgi:hypothetical protein
MKHSLQFYKHDYNKYLLRSKKKSALFFVSRDEMSANYDHGRPLPYFETECCQEVLLMVDLRPPPESIELQVEQTQDGELRVCKLHCEAELIINQNNMTLYNIDGMFRVCFALCKPFQCPCLTRMYFTFRAHDEIVHWDGALFRVTQP